MISLISIFSLLISASSLIIILKERSRRPYAADLEEFRLETERLIAEFNRVAERDTGILDDRLSLLQQEIRSARNTESALRQLIEETRRDNILAKGSFLDSEDGDSDADEIDSTPHPKEAFGYAKESPPAPEEPFQNALFDGFSVERIKSYAKHRNSPKKKHELLLQHLKENKNRDELLEMGFSPNEINLALLNLSTSQDED